MSRPGPRVPWWQLLAGALLLVGGVVVVGLVVLRVFFVGVNVVPQSGMYPAIPQGARFLSWKRPYRQVGDVARGDVVLFERMRDGQTYLLIWRVVGLPGERVSTSADALTINGRPVTRQELRREGSFVIFREVAGAASYEVAIDTAADRASPEVEVTLAADELFVLGDNRHHAWDSRSFGPILFSSIVGKKM